MAKISITLMFCFFSLSIWAVHANTQCQNQSPLQNLCEKVAKLQLYVQDVKTGPNTTVWDVARSNITSYSATDFGLVRVMDNKITAEPDFNSEEVGRAQSIIAFTDMQETAITMNFNFYLTRGNYSGATVTVLGRHPLFEVNRELPIVGGTGVFCMARGYAISNTYYIYDDTYAVVEYTLYVYYVEQEPCLDMVA